MKLTTRGNYAISALMVLLNESNGTHISLKQIAKALNLSENYLRQLFMELRKAGIVNSVRGVGGGYFLAKPLQDISILDIIIAVEGEIQVVPCLSNDQESDCDRIGGCSARKVWNRLNENIKRHLETLSLADLVEEFDVEKENTHGEKL